ncbi:MAG: DNA-binding response regulator [Oceanospirillales bacterium]|nr:MAG: DNA-binding response regulator [Oceanospirillales bacterium]
MIDKSSHPKILIIDDDSSLSALLQQYLHNEAFRVDLAESAEAAERWLASNPPPDLIILDIMMPGKSGLELLQSLRPKMAIPVIMLTGRGDDIDRILGLEMGADDYLAKPCNPRELLARIRAVLRRSQNQPTLSVGISLSGIHLDPASREVTINGMAVEFTGTEFNVLHTLMAHAGEVVSKESLTEKVLHRKLTLYDRAIDVHVSRVRQKLTDISPDASELIKTVRGAGYQFIRVQA